MTSRWSIIRSITVASVADGQRVLGAGHRVGVGDARRGGCRIAGLARWLRGRPEGDDRAVVGVGRLEARRCGPGGPAVRARRPTGRRWTGRSWSPPGTVSASSWTNSASVVTRDRDSEKESRVRAVASLRLASVSTEKMSRAVAAYSAYRLQHPGLPRGRGRSRGRELDQPAVAPPGGGDVDDQVGVVVLAGMVAPEVGGQALGLSGVEAAVVELDRRAGPDPDHQEVAVGGHHGVGPGGDLGQQGLHVVVEEFEGGGEGPLHQHAHPVELLPQLGLGLRRWRRGRAGCSWPGGGAGPEAAGPGSTVGAAAAVPVVGGRPRSGLLAGGRGQLGVGDLPAEGVEAAPAAPGTALGLGDEGGTAGRRGWGSGTAGPWSSRRGGRGGVGPAAGSTWTRA